LRLAEGFITQEVAGEQIMVSADSTRFLGIVRSNRTAAFIVDCLKKETSSEEIEAQMLKQFDAPQESVKRDVRMVIEKLTGIGAIEGEGVS
jgi:hypothetical protein